MERSLLSMPCSRITATCHLKCQRPFNQVIRAQKHAAVAFLECCRGLVDNSQTRHPFISRSTRSSSRFLSFSNSSRRSPSSSCRSPCLGASVARELEIVSAPSYPLYISHTGVCWLDSVDALVAAELLMLFLLCPSPLGGLQLTLPREC